MDRNRQIEIAKKDMDRAQREAREAAMLADEAYVPFLMDMGEAWREERRTGEPPGILASAPQEVADVYERFRDARNRIEGGPRHRWLVTEHMIATDFDRRMAEELDDMERSRRIGEAHLRRVREGRGPAL